MEHPRPLAIEGGTCVTPHTRIRDGLVVARGGMIDYVGPRDEARVPEGARWIDAEGHYVCPGFIDLQVNGGNGASVVDGTAEALDTLTGYHMEHGTTAMAPTLVSSSPKKMRAVLELVRDFQNRAEPGTAKVAGAHLEGPYLASARRGAHAPDRVREARPEEWEQLMDYTDAISLVTAAPEVPGVPAFARALRRAGITVSMGHSDATYPEVARGVEAGFSLVTHLYADTSTIAREDLVRTPGILEAAWLLDELAVSVIADDVHLPAVLVKMIARQKGTDRTVLISDAMRAAGMPDGEYALGDRADENIIRVEGGRAQTLDGTSLAGSTVAMDACLHTAVVEAGLDVQDAVAMATLTPARLLGVDHALGSLSPGKQADIVVTNPEFEIQQTVVDGRVTHDCTAAAAGEPVGRA